MKHEHSDVTDRSCGRPRGENDVIDALFEISKLADKISDATNAHDDGEVYELTFPMMTQWFQVQNPAGGALKLGFTSGGIAGTQYFTIPASTTTEKFYLRTKSIFIDSAGSGYSVIASLTGIPTGSAGDLENTTYWGV